MNILVSRYNSRVTNTEKLSKLIEKSWSKELSTYAFSKGEKAKGSNVWPENHVLWDIAEAEPPAGHGGSCL